MTAVVDVSTDDKGDDLSLVDVYANFVGVEILEGEHYNHLYVLSSAGGGATIRYDARCTPTGRFLVSFLWCSGVDGELEAGEGYFDNVLDARNYLDIVREQYSHGRSII